MRTCAIITVPANDAVKSIHDHMPAILTPEVEQIWLDPDVEDEDALYHCYVRTPVTIWKRTSFQPWSIDQAPTFPSYSSKRPSHLKQQKSKKLLDRLSPGNLKKVADDASVAEQLKLPLG